MNFLRFSYEFVTPAVENRPVKAGIETAETCGAGRNVDPDWQPLP
jgi:hypothetical protein